jgi:hypothetical protein
VAGNCLEACNVRLQVLIISNFLPSVQIYFGLLTSAASFLVGFSGFKLDGFNAIRVLGQGMHCTALAGFTTTDKTPVVIKLFSLDHKEACDTEEGHLRALAEVGRVPRVLHKGFTYVEFGKKHMCVLVVTPVGVPVRPVPTGNFCTGSQLASLVDVLQAAHGLGIAHRDVKPCELECRLQSC